MSDDLFKVIPIQEEDFKKIYNHIHDLQNIVIPNIYDKIIELREEISSYKKDEENISENIIQEIKQEIKDNNHSLHSHLLREFSIEKNKLETQLYLYSEQLSNINRYVDKVKSDLSFIRNDIFSLKEKVHLLLDSIDRSSIMTVCNIENEIEKHALDKRISKIEKDLNTIIENNKKGFFKRLFNIA